MSQRSLSYYSEQLKALGEENIDGRAEVMLAFLEDWDDERCGSNIFKMYADDLLEWGKITQERHKELYTSRWQVSGTKEYLEALQQFQAGVASQTVIEFFEAKHMMTNKKPVASMVVT